MDSSTANMKRSSAESTKSGVQELADMECKQKEESGGRGTGLQGTAMEHEEVEGRGRVEEGNEVECGMEDVEGREKVVKEKQDLGECADAEEKEGGREKMEEERQKIGEVGGKEEEEEEEEKESREKIGKEKQKNDKNEDNEEEDGGNVDAKENATQTHHYPTENVKVVKENSASGSGETGQEERKVDEEEEEDRGGSMEEEEETGETNERGGSAEEEPMLTLSSSTSKVRASVISRGASRSPSQRHSSITKQCASVGSPFFRQGLMAVVACLGGLSNGTIYSYPAVALARWEDAGISLSTAEKTWFASAPLVVAMVVCVVAGVLVERMGVRRILALGSIVLALTWLVLAIFTSFWVLVLARVVQGVVASLFMVVITVYPVEVSVVRWRGIMMGVSEAMVMLGAFLTYIGGLVMQASSLAYVFAGVLIPQLLCFFFLWESPLWLARRNRMDKAAASLAWLRGGSGEEVDGELEHIKASVYIEHQEEPNALQQLLLLRKMVYLKPVLLCVLVLLFKELTGQYAALTYTVTMFRLAGSTLDPYLCAVVMGAARFLPCFLSWALIERLHRRLLLSCGLSISSLSFATLGGILWYWGGVKGGLPESLGWMPLACICVFTLAFGCGVGPTSWTLVAELLPSQVRNVGAGLLNMCFSLFLFLVGFTFPYSVESLGAGAVFLIYSLCSLVGVIFVLSCLPETRGMSFIEIQTAINPNHKKFATTTSEQWESNIV